MKEFGIRWVDLLRPGAWKILDGEIYREFARQLFCISPSTTVLEAFLVLLIGISGAWRAQDPVLGSATVATCLLILSFLPVSRAFLKRLDGGASLPAIRSMERRLEWLIWSVSASIGFMAGFALLASADPLTHMIFVSLALGATITNLRDYFRPVLALGKTVAILAPPSVCAIMTGDSFYQLLGLGGAFLVKVFMNICLELYRSSVGLQRALQDKDRLARTLELKAVELGRVSGDLVQASRLSAMGAMGSSLAHELNQPLTAIVSYIRGSRRLLDKATPEALAQSLDSLRAAEDCAIRAGELIRSIRSSVSGKGARKTDVNLGEAVREALATARMQAGARGLECRISIPEDPVIVRADPIQIQQVLTNLIRNASDAMQSTEMPQLELSLVRTMDRAEIRVADNGTGVPAESADRLFDMFVSTKDDGMGVGLSIARSIVEGYGGRIYFLPGKDGGAEFRFELPLEEERSPIKSSDAADAATGD